MELPGLCAPVGDAASDSHDVLVSPIVPISLDVSERVQHRDAAWWVQPWLLCVELEVALASGIAGGWTDGWGHTVGLSQGAVKGLYT